MGIGPQDGLQHLFVLQAASAETRQRLTAAADGGLGERSGAQDVCHFRWIIRKMEHGDKGVSFHVNSASFLHLLDGREKALVRFSLLTLEPKRSSGLRTLGPKPWEADLASIKHSQLSSQ